MFIFVFLVFVDEYLSKLLKLKLVDDYGKDYVVINICDSILVYNIDFW